MSNLNYLRRRIYEGASYRLRSIAHGRWASHCRPTSITLLMTERCNARCVHCDIWKNRGQENRPTSLQWQTLLNDLRSWLGPVQVVFSGGEALLNPSTIDLVRYASSIGLFAELLTHGFWADQKKIEMLAAARAGRVTISLDGVGPVHDTVRGRGGFFDRTEQTIQTLLRMRRTLNSDLIIRLKTVIMKQNLADVCNVAHFAKSYGVEVFYQPIEQNYNTVEDPFWFHHSNTWPVDHESAIAVVRELKRLKSIGFPIVNSERQLDAMIVYFKDPAMHRVAVQAHAAHEKELACSALTTLQIQANGDVTTCAAMAPIGNIKAQPIREIWRTRPRWWESGCCLERRIGNRF
ncbi:MAG TPA: radical SAM protein [Candidatus Saccharimonadales bacterium]|nr:radical SAM protein [Candidatus Saccharimonadales bacterium]